MGKILVFASVAISIATAGLGFVNKGKLGDAQSQATTAQASADAAKKNADEAAAKLTKANNDLKTATAEKDQAVADATSAKSQAEKLQTELTTITGKVAASDTKIADLEAQLKTALESPKAPETAATTPAVDPELTARIAEQETVIAKLNSELEATRASKKVIEDKELDRQRAQLKQGTEGRVLAVNPAWNFVVLNLGDKQGAANNTELLVKRGTRYLGKVRITSVEPSTSIADIVANSMPQGTTITPGDSVIFQGSGE